MKALKISSVALALALIGGQAVAGQYVADSIANPLTSGDWTTFGSTVNNDFSDTYAFKLASGVSAVNFVFDMKDIGVLSMGFSASSSPNTSSFTALTSVGGVITQTQVVQDEFDNYSVNVSDATYKFKLLGTNAGTYQVKLAGDFTAALPEARSYSLTVSAVPEPESYAMFLAGLGMMAAVARRRAK